MRPLRTIAIWGLALGACSQPPSEGMTLREVGFPDFRHQMPADSSYYMPESIGSGVALLDYDSDGDLDIYAVNGRARDGATDAVNRLFRQDRDSFTDVTDGSGLADAGFGMGVAVGDIDNDGWPDVYVTNAGPDALYRNEGGTFSEATLGAGLAPDSAWGASAIFLDYDADGWLDLYVVNYVAMDRPVACSSPSGAAEYCGPTAYPGAPDRLYRNLGDGVFEDVTGPSNIGSRSGRGLGVVAADLDGDDLLDIYVANDGEPNFLWRNLGDGSFEEIAVRSGAAVNAAGVAEAGMGVAIGDVDGDGAADLFVTHLGGESNTLYRNSGAGLFSDETARRGLQAPSIPYTGFGTGMFDLENDGDLDILVANGRINRAEIPAGAPAGFFADYAEPNLLFINDGTGVYRDGSAEHPALRDRPGMSRGLALGDLDNDGAVDVVIMETGRELRLLRNEAARANWIGFRVTDPLLGGRDVIGTRIVIWIAGRSDSRLVNPGYGFLSSNDPRVLFGLGSASTIDSVIAYWPGGSAERFDG
ncbi:MAG: CRTAC1 family protein, partial [Gemmatimonadota bacterium]|nr:CRTAC1 family protein [Gemmatimonadota bacterium]